MVVADDVCRKVEKSDGSNPRVFRIRSDCGTQIYRFASLKPLNGLQFCNLGMHNSLFYLYVCVLRLLCNFVVILSRESEATY